MAVTLAGRPVVAVRDGETVRVLANVCAHRSSMLLDDGAGAGSRWSARTTDGPTGSTDR